MSPEYVQNLRYKLQKRVRRVNSAGWQLFHFSLQQFFSFLKSQEVLQGVLDELSVRFPEMNTEVDAVIINKTARIVTDEAACAAFTYGVLKKCVESADQQIEIGIGHLYNRDREHAAAVDTFRDMFLEPLYEYLDEQLDDQRSMLALLRRYKHKCEWFARETLHARWSADTQYGERGLAKHLYEYLHDQGIDFHIEPQSSSGEVDLIAAQRSDDPLVLDAKIFDPARSKGKPYIARGFAQVYRYTVDFNEAFGYLVIYQTSEDDLRFVLPENSQATPFLIHNNKTIFLITIDILPHEKSASKRGPLKPTEITMGDLIQGASDLDAATTSSEPREKAGLIVEIALPQNEDNAQAQ